MPAAFSPRIPRLRKDLHRLPNRISQTRWIRVPLHPRVEELERHRVPAHLEGRAAVLLIRPRQQQYHLSVQWCSRIWVGYTPYLPRNPHVSLSYLQQTFTANATYSTDAVPTTPPVPPNTERRRGGPPRARRSLSRAYSQQHSDYDSDDDFDGLDEEHHALRIIEQFAGTGIPVRAGDMDEERIRAHQVLRGQLSSKRVASRRAISSLQSVDISTLPESERSKLSLPQACVCSVLVG